MQLLAHGYCILEHAVPVDLIVSVDADLDPAFRFTPMCQGDFYGWNTKRFGSLLRRSGEMASLVQHPLVLGIADMILGPHCDRILLNLTQGVEIHPGANAQFLHRDQDMWGGPKGELEYLINVIWPLTTFTSENGGTVLYPGSHRSEGDGAGEDAVVAAMEPGSALIFLGSTLHGGGANRTNIPRRGIIISYCLGWLRPFENPWLVYPPATARCFDRDLTDLLGYVQHRPNLGNVEGQCPSILLGDAVPDHLPAIDALRPDQAKMLRDYVVDQGDPIADGMD
jgi:ectoine hydroxylase-related dioxygenase (phytanoyl-CoA dioxygenase family)